VELGCVKLVVFKKGGEAGDVAINPNLVTHVRSMSGPFTDIYFGPHRVAVEGAFRQVVDRLSIQTPPVAEPAPSRDWLATRA